MRTEKSKELPLAGITVVEFTHMVMGPAAGLILADLGADVIKVEPFHGDNTRRLKGSGAGYFVMYNRNKRSLCIDLKSPEGLEIARRIVSKADILIENFRPGAMKKLGLDYETLNLENPSLIYCSLKGFLSGPYEHRTALDEVTQMMGGLAYMTGLPDRPMRAGSSVVDISGGMFGVIGILAALQKRNLSGLGEHITSALFESTAFMVGQHMAQEAVLGKEPEPMSIRRSAWSIYDIFVSADDEKVFVGVVSDTLWRAFCKEFDLDEFANDSSLDLNNGRVSQRDRILPRLELLFSKLSTTEMIERLDRAGVPFAPINRPSDLFEDPHLNAHQGLQEVTLHSGEREGSSVRLPSIPLEMSGERFELRRDIPRQGEHSLEILLELGFSEEDITELLAGNRVASIS